MRKRLAVWLLWTAAAIPAAAADVGNRLSWVDDACNPYYVGLDAPKLVTPQWIGQEGVQAIIVLSIDDMRSTAPMRNACGRSSSGSRRSMAAGRSAS